LALDTLSLSTPLTLRNLEVKLNVSNDFNASAATAWNKTQLASIMQEIGQDAIGNRTVTIDIGNDTATITSVNSWYIQTRFVFYVSSCHVKGSDASTDTSCA
jgi:hypothetical protein